MSYRKYGKGGYDVRQIHFQFRNIWEQGLQKASHLIRDLKSKGWNAEEEFYFPSQAEKEAHELEKEGYIVQKHPVMKWGNEEIYILAYKPRPPPPSPPPSPKPKPEQQKKKRRLSPEERFKKLFWPKGQPSETDVADGTIMNPSRTMAFIRPDSTSKLAENAKKAIEDAEAGQGYVREFSYEQLLEKEKAGEDNILVFLDNQSYRYDIKKMKKALKVLGLGRKQRAKTYISSQNLPGVMVITDDKGNKVLIAPIIEAD